jgi:CRISPR-associated protein Csb1
LPPHISSSISSFEFPHRNADAYLRDAELDGEAFPLTDIGKAIFDATSSDSNALFEWMPQALLFGFWQSHLGSKGAQTKLARAWVSEIVGYEPATTETRTLGVKGDPLNLSISDAIEYSKENTAGWTLTDEAKGGKSKSKESLAEIGHGQVPFEAGLAPISFRRIEQRSTVSFAGLRRISSSSPEGSATGRALLVAIGIVGHVGAFGGAFSLRSGCDLRPSSVEWTWLGESGDDQLTVPDIDSALALLESCASAAEKAGLPVGSKWKKDPLVLVPGKSLERVLNTAFPDTETP